MKKRNIALSIIFTLITCGIYGLYWFVCLTDETNQAAGEQKTTGVMALIFTLITCGIYTGHIAVAKRLIRQRLTEERQLLTGEFSI